MSAMILQELQFWLVCFGAGAVVTFVYDLFRIFRRVFPHGTFWVGAEDLLFWIFTAFWIFFVFYKENHGSIRLYGLLAMAVGMLLYLWLFSRIFVKIVSRILEWIWRILIFPLKFLGKKLKKHQEKVIMKRRHKKESKSVEE